MMTLESLHDLEWEEDIQQLTGWSSIKVSNMIEEICYHNGLHPDDDRQEASQLLGIDVYHNARDWLLPKYVKKFEHEIIEQESYERQWQILS